LIVTVALAAGCATGRAYVRGQAAQKAGDWDTAVAYYKEALSHDARRVDVRLALERATREASQGHMARARQLEAQDQLPGAAAEYRMAADLDLTNALAAAKAIELDRTIRQRIEDARPKSQMQEMREQASRVSAIPQLAVDPRVPLPLLNFNKSAVRDVLTIIGTAAGINVTYDTAGGVESVLPKEYTTTLQGVSLQDALNQVLGANNLFYKVVDPKTILVSLDNAGNRLRLEDQVVQVFYISHADASEVVQSLTTLTTQLNALGVRPVVVPNKIANTILVRASVAVMEVIERLIHSLDKPRAEVVIDVEILEVDRTQGASYGFNLSQYQLGFTFSPEAAPPNVSGGAAFPSPPPPFNLNTVSQGVSMADFYMSVPTALIKALESDSHTRILAKPSLRGTEGQAVTLNLGEQIPVPSTTFAPIAAGGVASQPTTSFTLKDVGVNVSMTPKVTYENEIIIDLQVENSAKGPDVTVAGSALPSFSSRKVGTKLRLRDGESNLIAGLIREEDKRSLQGLPWISKIPWLRSLFGASDKTLSTSDIVMLITPRIVRGHELTVDDLKPIYVGTNQNFGLTGAPPLIATPPTAEELAAAGVTSTGQPPVQGAGETTPPATPPAQAATPPRNPVVVPITPVGGSTTTPPPANPAAAPGTPPSTKPATVSLTMPNPLQAGSGPYTAPIQIADVSQLGTVRITLSYDPKVLKARNVTQGNFLTTGGVTTVFTPKIDEAAGRVEIVISRPAGAPGVSGGGFLGAVVFDTLAAGPANMTMSVTALTPAAQPISVQIGSLAVVVK
jgi:general secretion pathway protein D